MNWRRFREPSTWAGLAVLLGVFGVQVTPDTLDAVVQVGTAGAALAAVLLGEQGPPAR